MKGSWNSYRMWLSIGVVFLCLGIPELVLRGLIDGSTRAVVAGIGFLIAAASSFWQARSEKRKAAAQQARLSSQGATEVPPSPGRPQ